MKKKLEQILHPVILKTPQTLQLMTGKLKTGALSRLARDCVCASAHRSGGLAVDGLTKDGSGAPLPQNGVFWSLSHKPGMVTGVVSPNSVGIDVEMIKPLSDALFDRIVHKDEAGLFPSFQNRWEVFFRVFTAKEAVLKKRGEGLRGLSHARVTRVCDERNLVVNCRGHQYPIENFSCDGYLVSVTKEERMQVQWHVT